MLLKRSIINETKVIFKPFAWIGIINCIILIRDKISINT